MNQVLVQAWLPDGTLDRLRVRFPSLEFVEAPDAAAAPHLVSAEVVYGMPPVDRLAEMPALRWVQLISAGVPPDLCEAAGPRGLTLTNLAGLYGPTIAEHAVALMAALARRLPVVVRNQTEHRWDRSALPALCDLHGRTLAVVGLGNIGRAVARLARAFGMRVVGCRRTDRDTPFVDRVYPCAELHALLAEADVVAVTAPLTRHTEGLLGGAEFRAMKRGVLFVNVSRGPIAREDALLDALRSGHVAAAALDVFAVEPLPADHPFWDMPQVVITPHTCGEPVNQSARPAERFARNLHAWLAGRPLEGLVNPQCGY